MQANQNNCLQRITEEEFENMQETAGLIKKDSNQYLKNSSF
jgi:hypothetical protein